MVGNHFLIILTLKYFFSIFSDLEEKLLKAAELAGIGDDDGDLEHFKDIDLDSDFDPDKYDEQMSSKYPFSSRLFIFNVHPEPFGCADIDFLYI